MGTSGDHATAFDKEAQRLLDAATTSSDICTIAKAIAVSDQNVKELFLARLAEGNLFQTVFCIMNVGGPSERGVVFDFSCPDGVICFVRPAFLAIADLQARRVRELIDPYIPAGVSGAVSFDVPDGAVPLSLTKPSEAVNVVASAEALAGIRAKEAAFLEARDLSMGVYGMTTPTPTTFGCPMTCGTPPQIDGSRSDTVTDHPIDV